MAIKNVFVHLDSAEDCEHRLNVAVDLAVRHEAHLSGIYQVPDINLSNYMTPDLGVTSLDKWVAKIDSEKYAIEEKFQTATATNGLSAEWIESEGYFAKSLPTRAHYADLIVAGQSSLKPTDQRAPHLEAFVLEAGRPVVVVPTIGPRPSVATHILVAWDETKESARAVHDALPLLTLASKVSVFTIETGSQWAQRADAVAATLCHHLARHGVNAEAHHEVEPEMSVAECLLSRAADLGSDLIVMGAYGHSRVRELVLGGTTRSILNEMTVPVLFSH